MMFVFRIDLRVICGYVLSPVKYSLSEISV